MRKLSLTEKRIYNALEDGKPHDVAELKGCLWDELASRHAVRTHMANLRKKGVRIETIRTTSYRLVAEDVEHSAFRYDRPTDPVAEDDWEADE